MIYQLNKTMRHSFTFPPHINKAVKDYINNAIQSVSSSRYQQEATYTAALAKSLEGVAYEGLDGYVKFEGSSNN